MVLFRLPALTTLPATVRPEFLVGLPFVERCMTTIEDDPCNETPAVLWRRLAEPSLLADPDAITRCRLPTGERAHSARLTAAAAGPRLLPLLKRCGSDCPDSDHGRLRDSCRQQQRLEQSVLCPEDMGQGRGHCQWCPIQRFLPRRFALAVPNTPDDKPKYPYIIQPDNLFGTTVSSMPQITDSVPGATRRGTASGRCSPCPWATMDEGVSGISRPLTTRLRPRTSVQSYPFFECVAEVTRSIFLP